MTNYRSKHPDAWERLTQSDRAARDLRGKKRREILAESIQNTNAAIHQVGFTEMPPLCISDPFKDAAVCASHGLKTRGVNFTTAPAKKNTFFSQPKAMSDPYEDPGIDAKVQRQLSRQRMLHGAPAFRPSSAATQAQVQTKWYDSVVDKDTDKQVLSEIIDHNKQQVKDKSREVKNKPRNIVTSWPKRGPVGVPGTLLSGHLPHMPDPYEPSFRQRSSNQQQDETTVEDERVPFRPAGKYRDVNHYYNNNSSSSSSSRNNNIASDSIEAETMRPQSAPAIRKTGNGLAPFRPGKCNTSGRYATIGPRPAYMADPMAKPKRLDKKSQPLRDTQEQQEQQNQQRAVWRPSSYAKTRPTRTIALCKANLGVSYKL